MLRKDNSNEFVKCLHFPEIPWCKVVDGMKFIPLFDLLLNEAKVMGDDLLEVCHRIGDLKATNVSFSNSTFVSKWPSGDYKVEIRFYDDADADIFSVNFFMFITQ